MTLNELLKQLMENLNPETGEQEVRFSIGMTKERYTISGVEVHDRGTPPKLYVELVVEEVTEVTKS